METIWRLQESSRRVSNQMIKQEHIMSEPGALKFILRPSTHEKQPTEQIGGEILYNRALCLVLYLCIWIMKLMK